MHRNSLLLYRSARDSSEVLQVVCEGEGGGGQNVCMHTYSHTHMHTCTHTHTHTQTSATDGSLQCRTIQQSRTLLFLCPAI